MDAKLKQIIEQATKLAERAIPAFEAEEKLKDIEPQFKKVSEKLAKLEEDQEQERSAFRSEVNKMADVLVTRGILEDSQKVAFVETVSDNPKELVDVVVKLSSEIKAETFGKVGELSEATEELDAFERLALEN
jgi:hypothetical protein